MYTLKNIHSLIHSTYVSLVCNISFLRITEHESKNKMSLSNLVRLFAPTLMTVDGDPVSVYSFYWVSYL